MEFLGDAYLFTHRKSSTVSSLCDREHFLIGDVFNGGGERIHQSGERSDENQRCADNAGKEVKSMKKSQRLGRVPSCLLRHRICGRCKSHELVVEYRLYSVP